jgi:hypothetical protein
MDMRKFKGGEGNDTLFRTLPRLVPPNGGLGVAGDADLPANPDDTTPPSVPANVSAYSFGDLETELSWAQSTDDFDAQANIRYDVYVNGRLEDIVFGSGGPRVVYGDFGENLIEVFSTDSAGNRSAAGSTRTEPHEIILDEADAMDWPTICKCDLIHTVPRAELKKHRGSISAGRRHILIRTIIAAHGWPEVLAMAGSSKEEWRKCVSWVPERGGSRTRRGGRRGGLFRR